MPGTAPIGRGWAKFGNCGTPPLVGQGVTGWSVLLALALAGGCAGAQPNAPTDAGPFARAPTAASLPADSGSSPTTTTLWPGGEWSERPELVGLEQLSADGTLLGVRLSLGCPAAAVTAVGSSESTAVDVHVAWQQPRLSATELRDRCWTYEARPEEVVEVRLARPVGGRVVRVNAAAVAWRVPEGSVRVLVTLGAEPGARARSLPADVGVAFHTYVGCLVVWPWDPEAVTFLDQVPVTPGDAVPVGLAPMGNPAPRVVEACEEGELASEVAIAVAQPTDPSVRLRRLEVTLRAGFAAEGGVDVDAVTTTWS
jgi:hypothetical protein